MINTYYPNELLNKLVAAVKGCFADCADQSELYIAGNCIVEILSALSKSDKELVSVLQDASGVGISAHGDYRHEKKHHQNSPRGFMDGGP